MDKELLITYIQSGLSQRAIANKIGKSQASVKFWLKVYGLKTLHRRYNIKTSTCTKHCNSCNQYLSFDKFYKSGGYCKICMTRNVIQKQRAFKIKCVEYKGNSCYNCGYKKSINALEFHHQDSTQKDFEISKYRLCKFDDRVKTELDKCLLLCSNCHREEHERLYWNRSATGSAADF